MTSKFSTQSILETIATHVKEGATLEDVQNNAFYENAPIHDVEEATKEFESLPNGKLGAIQRVRDFETTVCGEVCTSLSNPVSLANMVIFINSQTIMAKLAKKMGIGLDYELTKQQVAQLSNVDTMKKLLFNSSKKDTRYSTIEDKEKETNIMSQQFNTQAVLNNVSTVNVNDAIIVNAKDFLKALKFVAVATAQTNSRPMLQYVHVEIHENELTVEATDSHILAQQKVAASISNKLAGKEFLIDGKFAKDLSKATTKHGTHLFITPEFRANNKSTGKVTVLDGNGETFIDDNSDNDIFTRFKAFYPELDFLIPDNAQFEFETRKKELLPILKALKEKTNTKELYGVHLEIQDNSKVVIGVGDDIQEIKHRNLSIGDNHKVENNKGLNFEIDFNVKLLISELQKCKNTEFLKFSFSGTLRPFAFTRENGGIGLVTPLRTF